MLWGSICSPGVSHGVSPERCRFPLTTLGAGLVRAGTAGGVPGVEAAPGRSQPYRHREQQWDALTIQTKLRELP